MNKILKITLLTNVIAWSLQCREYLFVNQTDEAYEVTVKLSCGGPDLKGQLQPSPGTLKLESTGARSGCCFAKVKIRPLVSQKAMVIDKAPNVCGNKKFVVRRTLEKSYDIDGWGYSWKD